MSTTLDEAAAVEAAENFRNGIQGGQSFIGAVLKASRAVAREEIARSRAPVGEEDHSPGVGKMVGTPPAKDTGEAEPRGCPTPGACSAAAIIADLEARLAEATNELHCCDDVPLDKGLAEGIASLRRERDEARSSLETAERRIGELEAFPKSFSVSVNESSFYKDVTLHLVEPHALSIRLANSKSDKAWIFADLEARRLAALTPDAGTARSEDEEGG